MAVTLEPTTDMQIVRDIATRPDIWERASDGVSSDLYYPECNPMNCWLLVKDEGVNIGIFFINTDTSCSISIHPYLMKEHRSKGREMMQAFFSMVLESPDKLEKVNTVIPECFKSTINFAKKCGFVEEGISRKSYNHNGIIVDRVMLGMTREEVEHERYKRHG